MPSRSRLRAKGSAIRSQVYTLPGDTVLYPGHGPETTVAEEKANNPYVTA